MFKMNCQKYFAKLQKMKKAQSTIKSIKIGKQPGTTYCLGCKDYTQKKWKWQIKYSEESFTVLFANLINQDFWSKK